jgi:hypothetical protein
MRLKLAKNLQTDRFGTLKIAVGLGVGIFLILMAYSAVIYFLGYEVGKNECVGGVKVCREFISPIGKFIDRRTVAQKIEDRIEQLWRDEAAVAKAVFKAESGLRPQAVGYNCIYGGKSTWCRSGDRDKAWSVDCGVAMLNHTGQICPEEYLDWNANLTKAHEMWTRRGWSPWVAYTQKYYIKYL